MCLHSHVMIALARKAIHDAVARLHRLHLLRGVSFSRTRRGRRASRQRRTSSSTRRRRRRPRRWSARWRSSSRRRTAPRSCGCSSSPPQLPGAAEERERGKGSAHMSTRVSTVCKYVCVRNIDSFRAPAARSQFLRCPPASQPISIRDREIGEIPAR